MANFFKSVFFTVIGGSVGYGLFQICTVNDPVEQFYSDKPKPKQDEFMRALRERAKIKRSMSRQNDAQINTAEVKEDSVAPAK